MEIGHETDLVHVVSHREMDSVPGVLLLQEM